ncbi:hypothetical protein FK531_11300 [Rhodococcus spelaei]|uniref:Uncharacterized protein n=1 Tax=Rhodococcus spelaei TaxID=2546320 RepID=A0A541BAG1_9NOCA|nr:hypothetical protein [Rhodococcus spelaei]TQF69316.1 hypothetical protein FK531_11300 [Rhodococcus spelaei]
MLPALVFLAVLTVPVASHLLVRRARGSGLFRLEQFRPASSLAGRLPEGHDATRAYRDLQAALSRHEVVPPVRPAPHH